MNKDELTSLAERVEAATGPDREIDAAIVQGLYPHAVIALYCADDSEPVVFHAEPLVTNKRDLPAYTASLDAAMTLVPEAHSFHVTSSGKSAYATVFDPECEDELGTVRMHSAGGATPALALTAACLRARAALLDATTHDQVPA